MNTNYRKPLPGTSLDYFDTREAVDAIEPNAYAALPYTSRVLAEQLVRRCEPELLTDALKQLIERKQDLDFPWYPARVVCHDILGQTALDDLAGLRDAIADQGGDPSKVTIFGQSAGAMSVTLHAIVPSSQGLFSRVIAESNPAGINYRTAEQNYPYAEKVATYLNCSYTDLDCLRSKSWEEIVDAQIHGYIINLPLTTYEFLPYAPIIDGTIIPEQPMSLFRSGQVNSNVEAMVFGVTRNESLALFSRDIPINAFVYNLMVEAFFTTNSSQVLELYPASHTESNLNQV